MTCEITRKELDSMQAAAEVPGVDYSIFVGEVEAGHVVNVAFTGMVDEEHANYFAKYISLLLELNSIDTAAELTN